MKKIGIATAAGVLLSATPLVGMTPYAGAQAGATVSIIDLITYSADAPMPGVVCVDDTKVTGPSTGGSFEVGDIVSGISMSAGTHSIVFVQGVDSSCDEEPLLYDSFTVANGDDVTVALTWMTESREAVVWPNDIECLASDQARITTRNGAAIFGGSVNLFASLDGEEHKTVEDLGEGDQDTQTVAAPFAYSDVDVRNAADDSSYLHQGEVDRRFDLSGTGGIEYVIYLYGGADGEVGYILDQVPQRTCDQTTPTQPPSTTTTSTIRVAAPVPVRPAFAG